MRCGLLQSGCHSASSRAVRGRLLGRGLPWVPGALSSRSVSRPCGGTWRRTLRGRGALVLLQDTLCVFAGQMWTRNTCNQNLSAEAGSPARLPAWGDFPGLLGAVSLCQDTGPRKTTQYHRKCCWIRGHTRTRVSDSRRLTRPPSITKATTQVTFPLSQESLRLR